MAQDGAYGAGHDDFAAEPIRGLPELPPEGEKILWQGSPDWKKLAFHAFGLHWVVGYFALIMLWRAAAVGVEAGLWTGIERALPLGVLGAVCCGLVALMAYAQAKATVYTVTNRRVAMRIGAALSVTLNLPYRWIGAMDLSVDKRGVGTIALSLLGTTRISYLVCWPHVRPWRFNPSEPALRCIPEAEKVGRLLTECAEERLAELALQRTVAAAPTPETTSAAPQGAEPAGGMAS